MSAEPRIGVFVCDCGSNIASVVDVPAVVEYARGLDHVVVADEGKWSCSVDYLARLRELIRSEQLNRVVIAACTPRTHEPLFRASVREAGLNPYLLEFVSIREQVSWVHRELPAAATAKAKDLLRMGVAKAALLEEGEEIRLPVQQDCLIVGGGVAGMTAALHVAEQGFHAVLVEQAPALGGLLARHDSVVSGAEQLPAARILESLVGRVLAHPRIDVHTATEVASVSGYVGNYQVTLRPVQIDGGLSQPPAPEKARLFRGPTPNVGAPERAARALGRARESSDDEPAPLDISTIVVATGMREREPVGRYGYGEDPRVVTQLGLAALLRGGELRGHRDVVMIQCVGSKDEQHGCCHVGCTVAVKHARALKALDPGINVNVLYRDLSLLAEEGAHLEAAKRAGVRFLRFPDDRYPALAAAGDGLTTADAVTVRVFDLLLGRELEVAADLLVLTTGFCGDASAERTKGQLKVSTDADGFFQEAHVKLGPLDFPSEGVYLCGCAKAPKPLKESCEEGIGAAMRASIPMHQGYVEAEGIVADIALPDCTRCGLCTKSCPYGAIRENEAREPAVLKALCKGCGLCAADCPADCITLVHYTDEQLAAQVDAALAEQPEQKILGFVCHWCALGGVDMAGVSRLQYPPHGRLIRVMCSARVPIKLVKRAFAQGAAGVLVAGCEFPTCHYITGNYACEKRMQRAQRQLKKEGIDPERLWNIWCSAADGPKFARLMREMVAKLGLPVPTEAPR